MLKSFTVTTAQDTVTLDASRSGAVTYTVTNSSPRPLRAQLRLKALSATNAAWLSIKDGESREFKAGETQGVAVHVTIPNDVTAGHYTFRLDAVSEANPGDDYSEGPVVGMVVPPPPTPPPPEWWKRWWMWALAVVAIGLTIWLVLERRDMVVVPDVSQLMDPAQAEQNLKTAKLKWKLNYVEGTDREKFGKVFAQDPVAQSRAMRDTEVKLSIGQDIGRASRLDPSSK